MLPKVTKFEKFTFNKNSLFISSEGFEHRSITWISKLSKEIKFKTSYIIKYIPEKESKMTELHDHVKRHTIDKVKFINFHRFEPQIFENTFITKVINGIDGYDEIIIDISVMSKMLIMIILVALSKYQNHLRIIYTEPMKYVPTKTEYTQQLKKLSPPLKLPSYGVHDVVRTTMLSSVIMQRSPSLVIAFASFNEQLIRALLSVINPTNLFLINGEPPHLKWREEATQNILKEIINDYDSDNPLDENQRLKRRTSTLFYNETFQTLANIYGDYCYNYRIILAPTGSKMQSLACALFKICCPDIHIEYPTPESFYLQGYSSKEIRDIHEINFLNFSKSMKMISEEYKLNG